MPRLDHLLPVSSCLSHGVASTQTEMVLLEVAACLFGLAAVLYAWVSWKYSYWNRRKIKQLTPTFPFGNLKETILLSHNVGIIYDKLYKDVGPEPAFGIYKLLRPQFVVKDAQLVKDILIKEFSSIHDNDMEIDSSTDYVFSNNPFVLKGEKWKEVRRLTTTALTPGKIKKMVDHIKTVCEDLKQYLTEKQDTALEGKLVGSLFTSNVVTGCVFGISCNSFKDPDSEIFKNIKKTFDPDSTLGFNFVIMTLVPKLARFLRLRLFPKDVEEFFTQVVQDSIRYRKENSLQRSDFLQHLMQISEKEGGSMSDHLLMAHSMTFLVDGYETSSLLLSHVFDLLAMHPDVQIKLREEINAEVKSIDDISFDLLHSLPYLEAVVNETLRIRPPASVLSKVVTNDVTLTCNDKTYSLEKGTSIGLPLYSIQKDPKNFDNPDEFRPERFLDNPNPDGFFPFGLGPRQCLGYKFALTQVKACVLTVNKYFDIFPKNANPEPFEVEPKSSILMYKKGGVWVKFRAVT